MKTDAVGRVLSSVNSQLDGISYNLCYAYHWQLGREL
jgi:hypothetical protein